MRDSSVRDDDGLSLIELIVVIVVSGLFAGLLTVLFINGWTTQERSVARDSATGQASVVKSTFSQALRNATAVRVSESGTRVDAVVAEIDDSLAGWAWECRAWVLKEESIRYSAGPNARSTDVSTWTILAGRSSERPFDRVAGSMGGAGFALIGSKGVQLAIDITVGDEPKTVSISDGMTAQAVATEGAIACWS